jgi:hypothetical protein
VTLRRLRRFAFLATLVMGVVVVITLTVLLAVDGPSLRIGVMLSGAFAVLLALAGVPLYRR